MKPFTFVTKRMSRKSGHPAGDAPVRADNSSDNYMEWSSQSGRNQKYEPQVNRSDYVVYPAMIGGLILVSVGGLYFISTNKQNIEDRVERIFNGDDAYDESPLVLPRTSVTERHISLKEYRFMRNPDLQAAANAIARTVVAEAAEVWSSAVAPQEFEHGSIVPLVTEYESTAEGTL